MSNSYFTATGAPSTSSSLASTTIRTELALVDAGFTLVETAMNLKAPLISPALVTPNLGTPSAGVVTNLTGTAAGVSIGGNAATVTTNANLTGHITSSGNAAVLGSFTLAQLNTAISDANLSEVTAAAWSIKTTTYTAVAGDYLMADTTSAAFTITLPVTPSANHVVNICDYAGTYATNNLTIGRNSSKIMSLSEDMVISTNNTSITLTYIDSTVGWKIT